MYLPKTVLPFLRKGDDMNIDTRNEEPKKASIILPQYLWDIVEKDAKRCRRSVTKQIEAILVRVYNVEANVDLNEQAITEASHVVAQRKKVA